MPFKVRVKIVEVNSVIASNKSHNYRHVLSTKLACEPVQRSDATIARHAFSRFRASRDDAAAPDCFVPPPARRIISHALDGSIVIKSMGSYYAAALTCPMDLTPYP